MYYLNTCYEFEGIPLPLIEVFARQYGAIPLFVLVLSRGFSAELFSSGVLIARSATYQGV